MNRKQAQLVAERVEALAQAIGDKVRWEHETRMLYQRVPYDDTPIIDAKRNLVRALRKRRFRKREETVSKRLESARPWEPNGP